MEIFISKVFVSKKICCKDFSWNFSSMKHFVVTNIFLDIHQGRHQKKLREGGFRVKILTSFKLNLITKGRDKNA